MSPAGDPPLGWYWRVAIVVAAVVLGWLFVYRVPTRFLNTEYRLGTHAVLAGLLFALTVPVIAVARRYLDRRPWHGLGLPPITVGWRPLLLGMACWLVPAGVGFALCLGFGWSRLSVDVPLTELVVLVLARIVLVFCYEALPEELVFRGYVYRNLTTALPRWLAVAAQAALFTLTAIFVGVAGPGQRILVFFVFGVVLGILRVVTDSVWASVGFHLAFQTVAQLTVGDAGPVVSTEGAGVLQAVAFGLLPFGLGVALLEAVHPNQARWTEREPDPA